MKCALRPSVPIALISLLLLLLPGAALAQTAEPIPLLVAVRPSPPFIMPSERFGRQGIAIELWEAIAHRLRLPYIYLEMDLEDSLDALSKGEVDLVISPLTITQARERIFDFSFQYFHSGLTFASHKSSQINFQYVKNNAYNAIKSKAFITVLCVGSLLIILFIWFSIRHMNGFQEDVSLTKQDSVRRKFFHFGIQGLLMSAGAEHFVFTFRSLRMQLLSLFVYFFGLTFAASVFGLVTATFTQSMNAQPHYELVDTEKKKVAVMGNSTAEILLTNQLRGSYHEQVSNHATLEQALETLAKGEAELVLGDWAQLIYFTRQKKYKNKLMVQNNSFKFEPYGWGMPANSPWREPINQELIAFLRHPEWKHLVQKYMGHFQMIF